jgi:hypothetical protein
MQYIMYDIDNKIKEFENMSGNDIVPRSWPCISYPVSYISYIVLGAQHQVPSNENYWIT